MIWRFASLFPPVYFLCPHVACLPPHLCSLIRAWWAIKVAWLSGSACCTTNQTLSCTRKSYSGSTAADVVMSVVLVIGYSGVGQAVGNWERASALVFSLPSQYFTSKLKDASWATQCCSTAPSLADCKWAIGLLSVCTMNSAPVG